MIVGPRFAHALAAWLVVRRAGSFNAVLLSVVLAALFVQVWALPHWVASATTQMRASSVADRAGNVDLHPSQVVVDDARHLAEFRHLLMSRSNQVGSLRVFFAAARAGDLVTAESDYTFVQSGPSLYARLQIVQSVHGSFRQVRRYCESMLRDLPNAALDDLQFKRKTIGSEEGEATLTWTLFIAPDGIQPGGKEH